MADPIQHPVTVSPGAGKTVRVVTDLVTFKASAADTGGAYSLFETRTAPGQGTPPHRQLLEEETFYVLEGTYAFLVGDETRELGPGGIAFIPRTTVHAYTNVGADTARMIILATPGGIHERFFAEVGEPVDAPAGPIDVEKLVSVAAKYGIEILPPPSA